MGYLVALAALMRKNFRLSVRDSVAVVLQLLATFLGVLVLFFSQISLDSNEGFIPEARENRRPDVFKIPEIPSCIPYNYDDCYTIAYVPSGNADVERYIRAVANRADIDPSEVRGFGSSTELNEFLVSNPNRTQGAYIFEESDLNQLEDKNVSFIVQFNMTLQSLFPLGESDYQSTVVAPAMVHAMNRVIMDDLSDVKLNINYSRSVFPHPNLDTIESAFGLYGPLLVYGIFFISFVLFLYKLVEERERGLRDAMKLAGLYQSQHYISWGVPFLLSYLIITLLLCAWGNVFRFDFFKNTSFIVYFLTFYIFCLALLGWVFLFDVFTRRSQQVPTVAFNFFLFTYILASSASIVYLEDDDGEPLISDSALFLRKLFAILPPVMFNKAMEDTDRLAATGFGLNYKTTATYTDIFPVRDCWKWMIGSGACAFILAVYLDNVTSSTNGAALSPFYFLSPSYWRNGRKRVDEDTASAQMTQDGTSSDDEFEIPVTDGGHTIESYSDAAEDADVAREREAVASGSRDHRPIVIKNLCKRYGKITAVDNINMSVARNSVLALLGHNGCGKSTTVKMLSTALAPTSGDASINGLSICSDQELIRKNIGICPQFDTYWNHLTGREHVELFAALKGLTGAELASETESRLDEVGLSGAQNRYAKTYSGGMLRRLSVALALTGNPAIVILDECSTGLDPISRRDLWRIIERAKCNRVVLLITHSMEEAEALGDVIAIMASGKLRVLGRALHLKHKFGAGYRVTISAPSESQLSVVHGVMLQHSPNCARERILETERASGGMRIRELVAEYTMPRSLSDQRMSELIRALESRGAELGISSFAVNQSTLEDVFKKITSLSRDVDPLEDPRRAQRKWKLCCCK